MTACNMTNTLRSSFFGVVIVLAALAAPVNAAENAPNTSDEREFGATLLVCNTCHGQAGMPRNGTIPIIWGQQENYLVKQLHDFQSGDRNFEVMAWMAKTLAPAELGPAADFYAKTNWPVRPSTAASATPPNGVAICEVCHQQNLVGGPIAPRLAGQNYEYLVETMRRFADGERANSPDMTRIMGAIPPSDREAMARYISSR